LHVYATIQPHGKRFVDVGIRQYWVESFFAWLRSFRKRSLHQGQTRKARKQLFHPWILNDGIYDFSAILQSVEFGNVRSGLHQFGQQLFDPIVCAIGKQHVRLRKM
jgi:hypothetical protein